MAEITKEERERIRRDAAYLRHLKHFTAANDLESALDALEAAEQRIVRGQIAWENRYAEFKRVSAERDAPLKVLESIRVRCREGDCRSD